MPSSRRVRITLDVDPQAEPIQGHLVREGHRPQLFWGWIELSSAIETARAAACDAPEEGLPS
jgi:hypothetical protein